jgi:hypothetical protein
MERDVVKNHRIRMICVRFCVHRHMGKCYFVYNYLI